MTEPNHEPTPDTLDRAAEALRTAPIAPLPDHLADAVSAEARRRDRRRRVMRYIRYGSAATVAAGILIAAGVLWVSGGSAAAQVRKAAENAAKAKSVRVRIKMQSGGKVTGRREVYRQGDSIRSETTKDPMNRRWSVMVADLKTRQALMLNPKDKTARRTTLGTQEVRAVSGLLGGFEDIKEQLSGGRENAVKDLGFEKFGDRRMNVYEVVAKNPPTGNWKIWVNPKTSLPVRAQAVMGDEDDTTLTLDYDDWNKEFDPELFSRNVPKGYELSDDPLDEITPPERVPPEQVALVLFRRAMDNAAKAQSFRMVVRKEDGGKLRVAQRIDFQTNASRMETYRTHEVRIADLSRKKELVLDTREKTASVDDISAAQAKQYRADLMEPFNLLSVLRAKAGTTVRELPREKLGGRAARVYDIRRPQSKEAARLWVDDATGFPVRFRAGDEARPECVIDFTDWNEKLDPTLFSLDVPKGYTAGVQKPPTPPESEPATGPTQFILLHRAMDKAAKAKSVRVVHNRGGKGAIEWTDYFQGERFRTEVGHLIIVEDGATKRRLEVNTDTRTARVRDMTELELRELKRRQQNWLTEPLQPLIQNDKEYTVHELPSERQNGRLIKVYQIDHMIGGKTDFRITFWADAKTELPIRARIERPKAKANPLAAETNPLSADELMNRNRLPTTTIEYEDWNKEFDAKLFSLEVPKGYRTSDHPLWDTEPPPERTQFILFRRAMDNAEKATSMRAVFALDIGSGQQKLELKLYQQGKSMRAESTNPALVVVLNGKKALVLLPQVKTAQWLDPQTDPVLSKAFKSDVLNGWPRLMGHMKEGKFTALPDETLDGRKVKVYEQKGLKMATLKGTADLKVWVDPKKLLPVRARIRLQRKDTTITGVMNVLGWNEELDPKLFDMTVPKGYKVIEKPK